MPSIIVKQPDRGLDKSQPATDINERFCSNCQNVYFYNGEIRQRFGWGSAKTIRDYWEREDVFPDEIGEEITLLATNENNADLTSTTKYLYAFSLSDGFRYDATNDRWDCITQLYTNTCENATNFTARSGHGDITASDSYADGRMSAGFDNDASASFDLKVEIDGANTFKWSIDGGVGWEDAGVACSVTPIQLSSGGTDYCYISFSSADGHVVGNYWTCSYDYGANTVGTDATFYRQGSKSIKISVHADFGTGTICTYDAGTGLTGGLEYISHVRFWARSSVALDAGDLQIYLLDEDANHEYGVDLDGSRTTQDCPAMAVDTWTYCNIRFGPLGPDYEDILLGFRMATDKGALNLYIDSLEFVQSLGLDSDDTESEATVSSSVTCSIGSDSYNRLFITNFTAGHFVRYVHGTGYLQLLQNGDDYNTTNVAHSARAISGYSNHANLYCTREDVSGTWKNYETRCRWCDLNDADVWDTGTSGVNSLVDTGGSIFNCALVGGSEYVFKTDSIVRQSHVGGETAIYNWSSVYQYDGLVAPKLLASAKNVVIFAGLVDIYKFDGQSIEIVGKQVRDNFYDALEYSSGQYSKRSHAIDIKKKNLMGLFVPEAAAYPDAAWVWDYNENTWTYWNFGSFYITAGCSYERLTGHYLQRGTAFGTSTGRLYEFDFDSDGDTNDSGDDVAIDAYWDSKAFSHPELGLSHTTSWRGLKFDGYGDEVDVYYSTDEGENWTWVDRIKMLNQWQRYYCDFSVDSQTLIVRFRNRYENSTFKIRQFELLYMEGSTE